MIKVIKKNIRELNPVIYGLLAACLIMALLGRLLPHPANVSPLLAISLFMAVNLPRKIALPGIFSTLLLSDIALNLLHGYAIFGSWTFATYSALGLIMLFSAQVNLLMVIGASLFYWLWTNLFTWLFSGMYSLDVSGLVSCYTLALPFLHNSLLGDIFWSACIFTTFKMIYRKKPIGFFYSFYTRKTNQANLQFPLQDNKEQKAHV